jgi:hypothetical protein
MATLTPGDTLSLNALGTAAGQSNKTLSVIKGDKLGPISFSSFAIDSVSTLDGFTYVVENTSDTYDLPFSGAGSNFSRISNQPANFTWNVQFAGANTTNYISIVGSPSSSCNISVGDMNPEDPSGQTSLMTIKEHTISASFADGFNDHATNYNTVISKTIYSLDTYDGNTVLCLEIGDLIEGDELKSFDIKTLGDEDEDYLNWSTDKLEMTETTVIVKNVTYSFSEKIYDINNGEIEGTHEHPLLVKDSVDGLYRFKEIFKLKVGDKLIKENSEIEITSIDFLIDETVEIVTIDVEDEDVYLVNGYITHNKGGNTHTDLPAPGAPTALTWTNGTAALSWTAPASTGTGGITAYDVQIDDTSSGFGSLIVNETEWSDVVYDGTGLANATYWARVRAYDQGLVGAWSTTLNFTKS